MTPRRQRRTTPCCSSPSAARRGPRTSCRSWRTSPAGAASRASGSRRSASTTSRFGGRSPINDQNRDLLAAMREDLAGAGIDLPVYWGNRNWDPYLTDTVAADGGRRRDPGRLLRHQRLLVVLRAAGSTARTSSTPSAGVEGAPGARPAAALLQPPGLRGADGRRDARRARRAARRRPRRRAPGLRHPLDPDGDERRQRARRRRLRRPAPRRRRPRSSSGSAEETGRRHPHDAGLLLAVRAAAGAVAGAGRQRPPRGARRRPARRRRAGADRVRLRPHGGRLRPRHRGAGDRRASSGCPARRAATAGIDPRFVAMVRDLLLERAAVERGEDVARASVGGDRPAAGTAARSAAAPTRAPSARALRGATS